MKYAALLLFLPACGILEWAFSPAPKKTSREGASTTSAIIDAGTDMVWYITLAAILLSLFFPQIRRPIGAALAAFFGLFGAIWVRLKGLVTKDPND